MTHCYLRAVMSPIHIECAFQHVYFIGYAYYLPVFRSGKYGCSRFDVQCKCDVCSIFAFVNVFVVNRGVWRVVGSYHMSTVRIGCGFYSLSGRCSDFLANPYLVTSSGLAMFNACILADWCVIASIFLSWLFLQLDY